MLNADTTAFYVLVVALITIGVFIANMDTIPTTVCGAILYALGIFLLSASVGDPLASTVQNMTDNPLWLYLVAVVGALIIAVGVITTLSVESTAADLFGLLLIALGLSFVYATGVGDPLVRGIIQELHVTKVA